MSKIIDLVQKLEEKVNSEKIVNISSNSDVLKNTNKIFLNIALNILKKRGYEVYGGRTREILPNGKIKTLKYLCLPEVEPKEIFTQNKQLLL